MGVDRVGRRGGCDDVLLALPNMPVRIKAHRSVNQNCGIKPIAPSLMPGT
jgi:hypothetical protein